jgi:antitoxin (DNA-binding transcriptional repressor) of toxin-antitoxin stability system
MKPDAPVIEIAELPTRYAELLTRLRAGEEVVLADHGQRVGEVSPVAVQNKVPKFGTLKGEMWVSDDFDDPLPPEILAEFYK